jgi:hypothetical protein
VDIEVDRARYRATLMHRLHRRVNVGIEWNPGESEVGPLANLFLLMETHARPALSLGTSSDRIGTEVGKSSYYLTAAKRWPSPGIPLSGYVSLNWSESDEALNVPFGGTLHLGERYDLRAMYDGRRTHLLAGVDVGRFTLTALWVWLAHAGVAVSTGFGGSNP